MSQRFNDFIPVSSVTVVGGGPGQTWSGGCAVRVSFKKKPDKPKIQRFHLGVVADSGWWGTWTDLECGRAERVSFKKKPDKRKI